VVISGTLCPRELPKVKCAACAWMKKTAMWMMKTYKFWMQKPEIPQDRMKKAHHSG